MLLWWFSHRCSVVTISARSCVGYWMLFNTSTPPLHTKVPPRDENMMPGEALKHFQREVPALGLLGTPHYIHPDTPFTVDEEVQLVCKYLKALRVGGTRGIDRLYPFTDVQWLLYLQDNLGSFLYGCLMQLANSTLHNHCILSLTVTRVTTQWLKQPSCFCSASLLFSQSGCRWDHPLLCHHHVTTDATHSDALATTHERTTATVITTGATATATKIPTHLLHLCPVPLPVTTISSPNSLLPQI